MEHLGRGQRPGGVVHQHRVEVPRKGVERGTDGVRPRGTAVHYLDRAAERRSCAQGTKRGVRGGDGYGDSGGYPAGIDSAQRMGQEHFPGKGNLGFRHAVAEALAGPAGHQDDAHTEGAGNGFRHASSLVPWHVRRPQQRANGALNKRCRPAWKRTGNVNQELAGKDFVQYSGSLVLVCLFGQGKLRNEDLACLSKHALLARGKTAVVVAAPKVADNLCNLDDVARSELLQICLVTAGPVGGFLSQFSAEDIEDVLEAFLANDVANPNEVNVLSRYFNGQITLCHLELEIHLLFALDGPHLDLFDLRGTVVRVNNCFANLKNHVDFPLSRTLV